MGERESCFVLCLSFPHIQGQVTGLRRIYHFQQTQIFTPQLISVDHDQKSKPALIDAICVYVSLTRLAALQRFNVSHGTAAGHNDRIAKQTYLFNLNMRERECKIHYSV